MPDRFGFDHLGLEVRCIWCATGGPSWAWPDDRREEHHRRLHDRPPTEDELRARRDREAAERRERRHFTAFWVASHTPRACANPYCAEVFAPARTTRRFCSDRCRKMVARRRSSNSTSDVYADTKDATVRPGGVDFGGQAA